MIWMPLWHSAVACFTRIKKPSPAPPISTGGQNHANRSNHPEMVSLSAGKFAEQLARRRHIGGVSHLRGRESAEVNFLPALANACAPETRLAAAADALVARAIV